MEPADAQAPRNPYEDQVAFKEAMMNALTANLGCAAAMHASASHLLELFARNHGLFADIKPPKPTEEAEVPVVVRADEPETAINRLEEQAEEEQAEWEDALYDAILDEQGLEEITRLFHDFMTGTQASKPDASDKRGPRGSSTMQVLGYTPWYMHYMRGVLPRHAVITFEMARWPFATDVDLTGRDLTVPFLNRLTVGTKQLAVMEHGDVASIDGGNVIQVTLDMFEILNMFEIDDPNGNRVYANHGHIYFDDEDTVFVEAGMLPTDLYKNPYDIRNALVKFADEAPQRHRMAVRNPMIAVIIAFCASNGRRAQEKANMRMRDEYGGGWQKLFKYQV